MTKSIALNTSIAAFAILALVLSFAMPVFANDNLVVNKNGGYVKNVVVTGASTGGNAAGGAEGGNGGNGGDVDNYGDGNIDDTTTGNGGNGGNANGPLSGGIVNTGAAVAGSAVSNVVNTNDVRLNRDCGCEGDDKVINKNWGAVKNYVFTKAKTGDNWAGGAEGGNGGHAGDVYNGDDDDGDIDDTDTGNGGHGGHGGEGGVVVTGASVSASDVMTVLNRNVVRINRNASL